MIHFGLNFTFKKKKGKKIKASESNHLSNSHPPDFKISSTTHLFKKASFPADSVTELSAEKACYYQLVHLPKVGLPYPGNMEPNNHKLSKTPRNAPSTEDSFQQTKSAPSPAPTCPAPGPRGKPLEPLSGGYRESTLFLYNSDKRQVCAWGAVSLVTN